MRELFAAFGVIAFRIRSLYHLMILQDLFTFYFIKTIHYKACYSARFVVPLLNYSAARFLLWIIVGSDSASGLLTSLTMSCMTFNAASGPPTEVHNDPSTASKRLVWIALSCLNAGLDSACFIASTASPYDRHYQLACLQSLH
ncbi:hypothetical protein [Photobacterium profundum]|uniref:hypothetical protein n=1 Tax=Photobacterium profundum TaxID=74109 RepID=UPI0003255AC8|nr:hypothetical protein [Photobacterium profundum]